MSTGSWIYMLTVWALILLLNVFCFYRIFKTDRQKKKEMKNQSGGELPGE